MCALQELQDAAPRALHLNAVVFVVWLCPQVLHHNVELIQHFTGAVVESVQQGMHQPDSNSHTAGLVPAAAGAGAGGGVHALHAQHHQGANHSAAGLKQRRQQEAAGVQMTSLARDE